MRALAATVAVALAPFAARADRVHADATGYLDDRVQWTGLRAGGLVPVADQPAFVDLLELNVQLKRTLFSDATFFYADVSLFGQWGAGFLDGANALRLEPPAEEPALRPLAVPSELYVSSAPNEHVNLLVGRKRIVWGSGLAWNPTDLLNAAKDPTDPTFQRSGAWLARGEAVFEKFTLSALVAPQVTEQFAGLPRQWTTYPSWDKRDGDAHFLAATRLYALVENADVNAIYYFSNAYGEDAKARSRGGLSFSRYFFTDYELHFEALAQWGTTRQYANAACFSSPGAAAACARSGQSFFAETKKDDGAFYPRVLAGTRYLFGDDSQLSVEYLYQADGFTRDELSTYVAGLLAARAAAALGVSGAGGMTAGGDASGAASPQKFSFQPLRRHYAFASWSKPQIHDDWTVTAVVLADLEDLSGLATASLSWSAQEWVTLTLSAFAPLPGLSTSGALVHGGQGLLETPPRAAGGADYRATEFGLAPFDYRVLFEARIFY